MIRKIVKIDEELCDGCGLCVSSCVEGAIKVIAGKARLVSDTYCDGLGACLGECPQGAISIIEREAEEFDLEAAEAHMAQTKAAEPKPAHAAPMGGCPGSLSRMLKPQVPATTEPSEAIPSALGNWPVQLSLAPIQAPYFQGARLLICADCVPFAYADFHRDFLVEKTVVVGCPKLDDSEFYLRKLTQIFANNDIASVQVLYMEVPCCYGLVAVVRRALELTRKVIPATITKIGISGGMRESGGL